MKKIRTVAATATCAALISGLSSWANPAGAVPPLNCVADPDQAGCHPDEGSAGNDGGRAFLTDADVISIGASDITISYESWEWTSWQDVKEAVEDYWDIHSPWNRVCDFNSGCALSAVVYSDHVVFHIHH